MLSIRPFIKRIKIPAVFTAGIFDRVLERAVLFRRYIAADYCRGGHGFYRAGTVALDVASVRRPVKEGEPERPAPVGCRIVHPYIAPCIDCSVENFYESAGFGKKAVS